MRMKGAVFGVSVIGYFFPNIVFFDFHANFHQPSCFGGYAGII